MTVKPDLTRVWAVDAPGVNVVDPSTTTPDKFADGWTAEVPPFEHFNFIQKQVTEGLAHINEQGIAVWDDVTTYPVGGLAKGSDGNVYKALTSQSDNDPVSDNGTNWVDWEVTNRVIRVTSIAAMEAYSAPVGYVFSLNAGGRSGVFDVISGDFSTELSADTENGIYIGLADNPTATTKVAKRRLNGSIFVNWFGAEAGGFDCKPAFLAVADYIQSKGGNTILEFAPSAETYFYSQSKPAGDPSFYGNGSFFTFTDVDGVVIKGNKARVSLMDNTRFGSFDPITGVASPTIQTNGDYANGGGNFIKFTNSTNCYVENIVWDGNEENHIVGGEFGDTGYQIIEYGLIIAGTCSNFSASNCEFSHSGLDGIAVAVSNPNRYEDYNISFYNITCEYNGRQGCSLTGGSGILFQGCSFSKTARGQIVSSPRAGVDIEPEGGKVCTNNVFMKCSFHENTGAALLSTSSGDNGNKFIGCSFIGTTSPTLYFPERGYFESCYFKGGCTITGRAQFSSCVFDDEVTDDYPVVFYNTYFFENIRGASFNQCKIRKTVPKGVFFHGSLSLYNTEIYLEYSSNASMNSSALGYPSSGKGNNLNVYDRLTGTGQIELGNWSGDQGSLVLAEDNGHISPVYNSGGRDWGIDQYTASAPIAVTAVRITSGRNGSIGSQYGAMEITTAGGDNALPGGSYQDGDLVFFNNMTPGSSVGRVCTTSGVAGSTAVFKLFGSTEV